MSELILDRLAEEEVSGLVRLLDAAVFDSIAARAKPEVLTLGGSMREALASAASYAIEHFAGKTVRNKSDGSQILIGRQGIKHALSGSAGLLDALAATDLANLIANAKHIATVPDRKGRSTIVAVHFYGGRVDFGGQVAEMGIVVREHADGRRYYDHFELKAKPPAGAGGLGATLDSTSGAATSAAMEALGHQPFSSADDILGAEPDVVKGILDSLSAIDRIRLTSQLAGQVSAMGKAANAIERVRVAKQVAELVRQLTGDAEQASSDDAFATFEPQRDGSLIVRGDPAALAEAIRRLGGKPKAVAGGVRLTKGDARLREFIPVRIEQMPSGAKLEYHENGSVSVRGDFRGGYFGAAEDLARLESLFAEDHGAAEFERVFVKTPDADAVQTHEQEQAEIAARKAEAKAREDAQRIADARRSGSWHALTDEEKAALKAESDAFSAAWEAKTQAEWDATIGQGKARGNERYQAYLDTLEDIPSIGRIMTNVGYMAWIAQRLSEYKATGVEPMPYTNGAARDEWQRKATAFVRGWADQHLSERVKRERKSPAEEPAPAPEIVEHITGRGKALRGVIRTDLTYAQAKEIDPYTFKKNGGYFIREKHLDGYVPGDPAPVVKPQLTPEQQAQAEADRLANEQLKQQQKRAEQVTKLRQAAQSTIEKAEEELGRDRNTNTARRANMAAGITARNEQARAIGKTMQNLADAIESGEAKKLSGITSRAAVELLQDRLRQGMYETDRTLSYVEQERQKGRAPTETDARNATFPMAQWGTAGTSLAAVLEAIKGKKGSVELAKKIRFSPGPDAEILKALKDMLGDKEMKYLIGWWNIEQVARADRLRRAGINGTTDLREALLEYLQFREGARKEDPIKAAERAIIGQKVGIDFFPTPSGEAQRMVQLAGITQGERVLEPSAGNGNIADAAAAAGAKVDVIEISSQLRTILEAKGYDVVAHDFMAFQPSEKYDAVLMNPPFSNRMDAEHIMHAFDMLKPGGRLVAIAGEGVFFGSDKKAVAFREWLEKHAAEVEQLPQGTFTDNKLLARTSANARMLVMQKG